MVGLGVITPGLSHFRKASDPIAEGLENGDIMEDSCRFMGYVSGRSIDYLPSPWIKWRKGADRRRANAKLSKSVSLKKGSVCLKRVWLESYFLLPSGNLT